MGPKALDLFAGAGGFSLGLNYAGVDVIGAVEWDKNAAHSYSFNIGDHVFVEDITEFTPEKMFHELCKKGSIKSVDEINVICGGPPCPGFSLIGRSKISNLIKSGEWKGSDSRHQFIDDPRNKLFLEFVKYVEFYSPELFVMENVAGMESYLQGNKSPIIHVICAEFEKLGYSVEVKVMDSSNYFVPQKRRRVIFLGTRLSKKFIHPMPLSRDFSVKEAFSDLPPIITNSGLSSSNYLEPLSSITDNESKNLINYFRNSKVPNHNIITRENCTLHHTRKVNPRDEGIFPLLKSGEFGKRVLYKDIYPGMLNEVAKGIPSEFRMLGKHSKFIVKPRKRKDQRRWRWYNPKSFGDKMRRIRGDLPGPTIVAHLAKDGYMFIHPYEHRSISVREAARIQSFPDSFDFSAGGKIAFTSQFRQIGNAVPPLLGAAIGNEIMKQLGYEPLFSFEEEFQNP